MRGISLFAWLLIWFGSVGTGMCMLVQLQVTPNRRIDAAERIPAVDSIIQVPGIPTVVMFLHPRCPCSRASVAELERLMSRSPDFTTNVVALSFEPNWEDTPLLRRINKTENIHLISDPSGRIATRFNAKTSGEVFLYAPDGKTIFHGGITQGRGHEGDNVGTSTISALLRPEAHGPTATAQTPVYGCPLFASTEEK